MKSKKLLSLVLCALLALSCFGCAAPAAIEATPAPAEETPAPAAEATPAPAEETGLSFTAGTYEGRGAGRNGDIVVSVTVSDSAIESIEITEHMETEGICATPFEKIPATVIEHQSLAVDTVAGATLSSVGLLTAVEQALTAAGADIDALKARTIEAAGPGAAEEYTADVIVVGCGGAGMSASIAAAEQGASVIVLEKGEIIGGNTLLSGGQVNAADPELQGQIETAPGQIDTLKGFLEEDESTYGDFAPSLIALKQEIRDYLAGDTTYMFDSVNLHIIQCYQGGSRQDLDGNWYHGNYELIKTLCENSLDTIRWTENWGIEWTDELATVYGGLWKRGHQNTGSKGSAFFTCGRPYAESLGVEIMTSTAGKELIVENGAVTGIRAEKSDGTPVTLHANKGVVMATGGYGGSVELVREYNNFWPALPDDLTTDCAATITGDGIFMCRDIGASLVGMEFVQLMALSHPVHLDSTGLQSAPENTLYVNKEGVRFVNEYAARDVIAAAAFAQTDGIFYGIDDVNSAAVRYTQEQLDGWVERGDVWRSDTLEGLAEQLGMDPEVLVNTVTTYNSYVDVGSDPDFNKDVMSLKIETGPFYATPHKPNVHHTMGGVQINTSAQVINTNGNVIPGLYAAGEVTGGIHAGNRLGGNAVADALTFGRIAGTNVVK